ncbi:hypothetical protein BC833DRAFT_595394 [Globomyces pollinis-pini]|nr:hypothetical protein BC833DRAFT_595394 [Globomyces pollinis-pini]
MGATGEHSITCISFPYNITRYDTDEDNLDDKVSSIMATLCDKLAITHKCKIVFKLLDSKPCTHHAYYSYSISIIGPFHLVLASKSDLLSSNPSQHIITLKAIRNCILDHNGLIKLIAKLKLDNIKSITNTQITLVNGNTDSTDTHLPLLIDIEIVGHLEATEKARLLCLTLFDELFGLQVSSLELNPNLHYILAGRKRVELLNIMQEHSTNIYLPIPFSISSSSDDFYQKTVYITGNPDNIAKTADRLTTLAADILPNIISKHVPCLPRKLEWLFTRRKNEIRKIMADNAVCFTYPDFANNPNLIHVLGLHLHLIERAIRSIKRLVCDFYVASIQAATLIDSSESFIRWCNELNPALTGACMSGSDMVIYRNIIEIYGIDTQIKKAYQDLTSADSVKIRDTKIQLELSVEHRDFINGKKNGKINRITKTSGCRLVFQENEPYNMMIDLYSAQPSCLLLGVSMLEEELPAEMSFHIPETFHKRIIGVGGKNIQKIMKRFGVYVKFSNMEEYAMLGGYYENADNVICRTPSKNSINLKDLKASIVEAVNATDLLEEIDHIDFPRQLLHYLYGDNGVNIKTIEMEYKVRVTLPDTESGSDTIQIEGPESGLEPAIEQIKNFIPFVSDFPAPGTPAMINLLQSQEFADVKMALKDEYDIDLFVSDVMEGDIPVDFSFFFVRSIDLSAALLEEAKNLILNLFTQQQVPYGLVSRSESYANLNSHAPPYDSFQHFNSKLIASVTSENNNESRGNLGMFSNTSNQSSVTNIRHLFDEVSINSVPPGLHRTASGPDFTQTTPNSIIGRSNQTNMRHPLSEQTEFSRVHRPPIGDFSLLGPAKSVSMTDILQGNQSNSSIGFPEPFGYRSNAWGSGPFSKSLSSNAILSEVYFF